MYLKEIRGSPSRDLFKWLHKQLLDKNLYALNSDFELVEKWPRPFIVARLDFKASYNDPLNFTEIIAYNYLISLPEPHRIPVYIIVANNFRDGRSPEETLRLADYHRFDVYEYLGGDYRPNPPRYDWRCVASNLTWAEFGEWELALRRSRREQVKRLTSPWGN